MRAKTVNFNREGTPYEKLGIGRSGIKKALLANPTEVDSYAGDANREWMNNLPQEVQEDLDYNPTDPLAFSDYYGFDEDWYFENEAPEDLDIDDFEADFHPTGPWKFIQRDSSKSKGPVSGIRYQFGKLPEGNKVVKYQDGLGSGYIAHKSWLK